MSESEGGLRGRYEDRRDGSAGRQITGRQGVIFGCEKGQAQATRDRLARERVSNVLVYGDMLAKTGQIHYALLAQWPYQPTEAEIDREQATMNGHNRKARAVA